jgi:hypothetical protein
MKLFDESKIVAFDAWLTGPRFALSPMSFRVGAGDTYLLEFSTHFGADVTIPEMIAGPVARLHFHPLGPNVKDEFEAVCQCCKARSKVYKRRNEPSLRRWAHAHRCPIQ